MDSKRWNVLTPEQCRNIHAQRHVEMKKGKQQPKKRPKSHLPSEYQLPTSPETQSIEALWAMYPSQHGGMADD